MELRNGEHLQTEQLAAPGLAPPRALQYRLATRDDFWAVADVHCLSFHPQAAPFWDPLLRFDRVLSLQVGECSWISGTHVEVLCDAPGPFLGSPLLRFDRVLSWQVGERGAVLLQHGQVAVRCSTRLD